MFFENEYLNYIVETGLYICIVIVLFAVGRFSFHFLRPKVDFQKELAEHDNFALFISYIGYFVGLLLAIGSVLAGPEQDFFKELTDMSIYGALAILLLHLSAFINEKVLFSKIKILDELVNHQNISVGIVEAANYIATGLIILGAVSGSSDDLGFGLLLAAIFWAIGQVLFILTALIYDFLLPYETLKLIRQQKIGVAIGHGAALVAVANLVRYAIEGDFVSWSYSFSELGIEVGLGILLLPAMRWLFDKALLPGTNITQEIVHQSKENYGAAFLEAFAYIGSSVLITWIV